MGIDSGRRLFRQIPAQMMKQQRLLFFGFSDARQTEMAAVTQAEPASGGVKIVKIGRFENRCRRE